MKRGLALGVAASLFSAATALIVARAGGAGNPLWLLLAQYFVGALMAPPRRRPAAPLKLHVLRLAAGLWAFGGYYMALQLPGARASEVSMVLNTAPVFATFWLVPDAGKRFGALLAFCGVAGTMLGKSAGLALAPEHALALTAAVAYAGSFILLGALGEAGEAPSTTNAVYNWSAGLCVLGAVLIVRPQAPASWWPAAAVGAIAAARIQILTVAAVNPEESARVSVLANLAFVWLAAAEWLAPQHRVPAFGAMALVLSGVALSNAPRAFTGRVFRPRSA